MKKEFAPEKYSFKKVEGMSERMLSEHTKLYEGYVKKTNEMQKKIAEADKTEANGVYSYIGELKRQETFAVNGMKLHEVYFSELGDGVVPTGAIAEMLNADFASFTAWHEYIVVAPKRAPISRWHASPSSAPASALAMRRSR